MAFSIYQITDKQEHDQVVEQSREIPTAIYVPNSNLPMRKTFTPKYEKLSEGYTGICFCQMELQSKKSMLFKFSPNQLPVTVLMVRDAWCKTVTGDDVRGLEAALQELDSKKKIDE